MELTEEKFDFSFLMNSRIFVKRPAWRLLWEHLLRHRRRGSPGNIRSCLQKKYGSLGALNEAWGTVFEIMEQQAGANGSVERMEGPAPRPGLLSELTGTDIHDFTFVHEYDEGICSEAEGELASGQAESRLWLRAALEKEECITLELLFWAEPEAVWSTGCQSGLINMREKLPDLIYQRIAYLGYDLQESTYVELIGQIHRKMKTGLPEQGK